MLPNNYAESTQFYIFLGPVIPFNKVYNHGRDVLDMTSTMLEEWSMGTGYITAVKLASLYPSVVYAVPSFSVGAGQLPQSPILKYPRNS